MPPGPTPFFERTLHDVPLLLDEHELLVVDEQTAARLEVARLVEGARFGANAADDRIAEFFGERRASIRRHRLGTAAAVDHCLVHDAQDVLAAGDHTRAIVATSRRELDVVRRLRAETSVPVLSLKNHVHPAVRYAGDLDDRLARLAADELPERALIVLAVMRTGSYLLCELAEMEGLGHPEEHIKDDIINALRRADRDDLSFVEWYRALQVANASNGWFATKLISHYHRRLMQELTEEERHHLRSELDRADVAVLTRRDRVRQAVSSYVARTTKVYRALDDRNAEQAGNHEVPYDRAAIQRQVDFLSRQTAYVHRVADGIEERTGRAPLRMEYEQLADDLTGSLDALCRHVGRERVTEEIRPRNRRLATSASDELAERFTAETGWQAS